MPPPTVLNPDRLAHERLAPNPHDIWYSLRRYFVDEFYTRHVAALEPASRVLDIGGRRSSTRGQFDIRTFDLRVTTLNIDRAAEPDILGDAGAIPVANASFDAVILAETVEHLPEPDRALAEASRVLRPGGVALITAPFMYQVHPDPVDVGRYTPSWWNDRLARTGFREVAVERQGMFLSVLADMLRAWAAHLEQTDSFWPGVRRTMLGWVQQLRESALHQESKGYWNGNVFYESFTTGYGIRAVR